MVSFIVRLKFHPEDRAEVAETLRLLATASRQEPGCVTYVPHQLEDARIPSSSMSSISTQGTHRPPRVRTLQKIRVAGIYQKMLDRSVENLIALV